MHPLFNTTTTFFEANGKLGCAESQKKTLKKFWIEQRSFTTFAAPIKRGSKMDEGSEVEKKLEKRFGLTEVLVVCLPPV